MTNNVIKKGRYECDGQPTVIVTDDPNTGPWVTWHFDWDEPEDATKSLWYEFEALLATGYHHIQEEE